jgi:methionyl-tRNA formyltransferase
MFMSEGLDTGDILLSEQIEIGEEETSGELHDRLSLVGAQLLIRTLRELEAGTLERIPQKEEGSSYVSILTKELSPIDWNDTAAVIHNQVRGLSPWPVASTSFYGKQLKVYKCKITNNYSGKAGQVISDNGQFVVCCGDNTAVELLEVQYEGGKRMSGKDFLRGHPADKDTIVH